MNEDDKDRHSDWYRTGVGDEAPEGIPSTPADTVNNDRLSPPLPSAGASPSYAEPYWSSREQPHRPQKPKKSSSAGVRAIAICLLVLVLIVATALIFTDGRGNINLKIGDWTYSSNPTPPAPTGAPGGFDEDFRDYFNNFYTDDGSTVPSGSNTIPKAELGADVPLTFAAAGEKELTLQKIYEKCAHSVVAIAADVDSASFYWGSGIVLSQDGYIVTNAHVLDGTKAVTVTLWDNSQYEAKLVGTDVISDIAVLKIDAVGLSAAEFGDSADILVGDNVVAIGNPLGEQLRGTMTDGIISAISRDIPFNNHSMTLLQTNAAINEGNSGGPLINMFGQVIGITNMKMRSLSMSTSIEGISFAIPSSTIKTIVDQLIKTGAVTGRPVLGITVGAIPGSAADYYELPKGLYISSVTKGSDAEAQGIQTGDILTAVNGKAVSTTYDVSAIKDGHAVGDKLTLSIYRSGESFDVSVTLMEAGAIT
ncbi:MAG: trypsin-like peptidase domain-containing protein [Oscillospiraceae bacterium]